MISTMKNTVTPFPCLPILMGLVLSYVTACDRPAKVSLPSRDPPKLDISRSELEATKLGELHDAKDPVGFHFYTVDLRSFTRDYILKTKQLGTFQVAEHSIIENAVEPYTREQASANVLVCEGFPSIEGSGPITIWRDGKLVRWFIKPGQWMLIDIGRNDFVLALQVYAGSLGTAGSSGSWSQVQLRLVGTSRIAPESFETMAFADLRPLRGNAKYSVRIGPGRNGRTQIAFVPQSAADGKPEEIVNIGERGLE